MADQNNIYDPNRAATGGHIPAADPAQQNRERMSMEIMAASAAAMHANVENEYIGTGEEISTERYNTIIGVLLLYGFVVNAILCFVFTKQIMSMNYAILLAIYVVGMFAGMIICHKTENPVISFIGYNLIVVPLGLFITPFLSMYRITTIRYAFCVMGVCTLLMIGLAELYPQFFKGIGRMLLSCLIVGLVGEIVMWCVGLSSGIFDFAFVGILMGYIGYDWAVAQNKRKTTANAVLSAGLIFADMIYMLIRLLRILSSRKN